MLPTKQTIDVIHVGDTDTEWSVFVPRRRYASWDVHYHDYFPAAVQLVEQGWCAITGADIDNLFVHTPEPKHLTLLELIIGEEYVFKERFVGSIPIWMYHSYLKHLVKKGMVEPFNKETS